MVFALFTSMDRTWMVALFLAWICEGGVSSTKLCPSDNYWFDADSGVCKSCTSCGTKSLELEPCSDFKNTMCVDLAVFRFDFNHHKAGNLGTVSNDQQVPEQHRWHEREDEGQLLTVARLSQPQAASNPAATTGRVDWGIAAVVVLCLSVGGLLCTIGILMVRNGSRAFGRNVNKRAAARARLFSRDRLNTTEYMNNLATLDRRLAMDEILEKRKKAIFEPQLLCENVYTDDVFVDLSGFPSEYNSSLSDKDQEHRQSLLRIAESQ